MERFSIYYNKYKQTVTIQRRGVRRSVYSVVNMSDTTRHMLAEIMDRGWVTEYHDDVWHHVSNVKFA